MLFLLILVVAEPGQAAVSFNRDIRPIMSDTCFACHGPDKSTRMAGLRLDLRDEAIKPTKSGVTPIVPGDPSKSAIVQRVLSADAARVMPPKYSHKELSETQKQTIRQWVAEGAVYEGHWAYQPVRRPAVPSATANPIDAFLLARLAKENLQPSGEADRRTLLRRASLDLTGLPPKPADVEAFVHDKSPDAYATRIDALLASPHYAEKQTMHWLDAVRYADTCGFHGDNPFPAWPYRDYVLRSFRDNKPFDLFTREQLAGDLMPGAGVEEKTASAYNRMNRTSAEGGLQPKEYLAKYAADRVRTTSNVWLGSTMGCSECHDHKFDPFTAKDFYSMKAFFADIKETGLVPDRGPEAFGSQLALPSEEQERRLAILRIQLAAARRNLARAASAVPDRQAEWESGILQADKSGQLNWHYQRPIAAKSQNGAVIRTYNDELVDTNSELGGSMVPGKQPGNGLMVVEGPNPDNETYIVTLKPGAGEWTALAVDVLADESLAGVRVARGADRLLISEVEADAGQGKLAFSLATASLAFPAPDLPPMAAIDGDPKTGWGLTIYGNNTHVLALRFAEKLRTTADSTVTVRLRHDSDFRRATAGRFRLALSSAIHSWPDSIARGRRSTDPVRTGLPENVRKAIETEPSNRTGAQSAAVFHHFAWAAPEFEPLQIAAARAEAELGQFEATIPRVVVTEAVTPETTRLLPRGNWMDDSGEIVEPAIPAFLGKVAPGRRATRLDLAEWIGSTENPLTARVFVNRIWRQFFGTGLSRVLEDLGSQGEWPSHPELLDWLAAEFMKPEWNASSAHAWDVKHIVRAIVLSDAYRRSSLPTPELEAKDPYNRLLARQSRFRVDAESVRDVALQTSGLLTDSFGGPPVRPYQPEGHLAALNFPKRGYSASRGESLYRRGLYTFWQRTFLHPSMATFDAPTREECAINRTPSNTPLQALVLLNDPTFVEAARVLGQNMLSSGGTRLDDRIDWAFLRAVSRKASPAERRTLSGLYETSLRHYRANPAEAKRLDAAGEAAQSKPAGTAELAAMTTVARAILNMHETITRN